MATKRQHAVVIGGSMAGLLAARVLADHFEHVTIIERDTLSDLDENTRQRHGIPQARHIHGLLLRGLQIIESYFPGFERELADSGAVRVHWMRETIQLIPTGWTPRFDSGIVTYSCSRPHLDALLLCRLYPFKDITIMDGRSVSGLLHDGEKITGVRVDPRPRAHAYGESRELYADLVVDTSGRGSQAINWLKLIGFPAPAETKVDAKLGYSSRVYKMPPDFAPDWKAILMMTTAARPRGGVFQQIENDHAADGSVWMLTLAGTNGDLPPTDETGLSAFARSIPAPPLHDALERATPITPIYGYQRTGNLMRHYEKLTQFPSNFVLMGDSVCAFNPVYGQGMTAAAMGAQTLDAWLKEGSGDGLKFQAALAKSNAPAWQMAITEDWRYSNTTGNYPGNLVKVLNRYVDWLFDAAPDVPEITQTFLQVMHLIEPSTALFKPSLILKRLKWKKRMSEYPVVESERIHTAVR